MEIKSTITLIQPTSTSTDPQVYKLVITGKGTQCECQMVIKKLLSGLEKK